MSPPQTSTLPSSKPPVSGFVHLGLSQMSLSVRMSEAAEGCRVEADAVRTNWGLFIG